MPSFALTDEVALKVTIFPFTGSVAMLRCSFAIGVGRRVGVCIISCPVPTDPSQRPPEMQHYDASSNRREGGCSDVQHFPKWVIGA